MLSLHQDITRPTDKHIVTRTYRRTSVCVWVCVCVHSGTSAHALSMWKTRDAASTTFIQCFFFPPLGLSSQIRSAAHVLTATKNIRIQMVFLRLPDLFWTHHFHTFKSCLWIQFCQVCDSPHLIMSQPLLCKQICLRNWGETRTSSIIWNYVFEMYRAVYRDGF